MDYRLLRLELVGTSICSFGKRDRSHLNPAFGAFFPFASNLLILGRCTIISNLSCFIEITFSFRFVYSDILNLLFWFWAQIVPSLVVELLHFMLIFITQPTSYIQILPFIIY